MNGAEAINANPTIVDVSDLPSRIGATTKNLSDQNSDYLKRITKLSLTDDSVMLDDSVEIDEDLIDEQEVFDLISTISDPEHPLTLAQLAVVNLQDVHVTHGPKDTISDILIKITPTITHCSLATLIGLGIRVRLERSLPPRFRFRILIKEGTHQSENQVNKQLNDKERVAAACENDQLLGVISQMLQSCR